MARRFGAGGLVLLLAGAALAANIELDEFLMEDIEAVNKSLASNVALQDVAAAGQDAQQLGALFAQVETYFAARSDAADALDYARSSRAAAASIAAAVEARQFETAANVASDLSRTCKTCHRKYRTDAK